MQENISCWGTDLSKGNILLLVTLMPTINTEIAPQLLVKVNLYTTLFPITISACMHPPLLLITLEFGTIGLLLLTLQIQKFLHNPIATSFISALSFDHLHIPFKIDLFNPMTPPSSIAIDWKKV